MPQLGARHMPAVVAFMARVPTDPKGEPVRVGLASRLGLPVLTDEVRAATRTDDRAMESALGPRCVLPLSLLSCPPLRSASSPLCSECSSQRPLPRAAARSADL